MSELGRVRRRERVGRRDEWSIDLRPWGRIYAVPNPADGTPIPLTEDTARRALEAIRADVARGKDIEAAVAPWLASMGPELEVLAKADRWLEHVRDQVEAGDRSPTYLRELERYVGHAGYWARWWQGRPIVGITYGDLEDWNAWLAKRGGVSGRGLSAKTRHHVLGAFSVFLRWLRRRGEIDADDVPDTPAIEVGEYAPTIIDAHTQQQVLDAIPHERRGAFLACALGVRPGEARALNVGDFRVDDERVGWLTIARAIQGPNANARVSGTKERNVRAIPVSEELRDWIEERVASVARKELLRGPVVLFPNPTARNRERRWIANALREEWNRAAETVGVRVRMYEGTKHAFATDAARRGVPDRAIQKYLGHRDLASTERYRKLADGALVSVLPSASKAGRTGRLA